MDEEISGARTAALRDQFGSALAGKQTLKEREEAEERSQKIGETLD